MSKKVPDWFNDSDFDFEPVIVFKTEKIHFLTFLDEGVKGTSKIVDDDDKEKIVPCVNYLVTENNDEKKFNPIGKQLIHDLMDLFPLTNRTFRIELIKGKTQFENVYEINELKK